MTTIHTQGNNTKHRKIGAAEVTPQFKSHGQRLLPCTPAHELSATVYINGAESWFIKFMPMVLIGRGKTTVDCFSAAMVFSVCR